MKTKMVAVHCSTGRILCCTVLRRDGKKLLAKGHLISNQDIRLLENEGLGQIAVIELEPGEVGEDDAVCAVASEMGCGSYEIKLASGGRANLIATEDCCVLIDDELLKHVNCMPGLAIATLSNFAFVSSGHRIATVKSAPFGVAQEKLDGLSQLLRERGPILQARPIRNPVVSTLYSDPVSGNRAREMFENVMRQRLERFGAIANFTMANVEREEILALSLRHLLLSKPSVILIASTTAPACPGDVVGRALSRVGGQIERFLAPVEPGNLLMLAYQNDIPIISAPGCFRSTKPNVVDMILPALLARYRISSTEIASFGHGGLLR